MQQILIIGSELKSCKTLKYSLLDDSMGAYYTLSVQEGFRHLIRYGYQLVVLDSPFPDRLLVNAIERLRRARCVPILVLSDVKESDHIAQILSVADDFLQKPYDTKVYRAKVKALLRRLTYAELQEVPSVISKDGTLFIDAKCRKVYVLETEISLQRKQYELLYLMLSNEGRVFTRERLFQCVWGNDFVGGENTLSNQIRELRLKLKAIPNAPEYIQTVYGIGYRVDTKAT